jgi:hypothetical protein
VGREGGRQAETRAVGGRQVETRAVSKQQVEMGDGQRLELDGVRQCHI